MSVKNLLYWMRDEDRSIGYVAHRSGIDAGRVIDLIAGAAPTDDEVAALSVLTGVPADELRGRDPDRAQGGDAFDPLRCYTVAGAAALMGVSPDTVRGEIKSGDLAHVVIGARAHRIPRWALEQRLLLPEKARDGPGAGPDVLNGPFTVEETQP